ncbi:MAG TPA: CARDB domain-containing protein [Candidatus Binatia bacterium]|nr:CARDB domain-containing protein [Candidatus Binatia bacterium]
MKAARAAITGVLIAWAFVVEPGPPADAGGQVRMPPNPEDLRLQKALQHSPDLLVRNLGLSATGFVAFTVVNQGHVAAATPFVADVFVNELRRDTIKFDPLRPAGSQAVQSALARAPDCKPVQITVVVDAQNVVSEASETNNVASRQVVPPCPDLVATISMDRMNNNLQYKAKVTVSNRGTLASGPFIVHLDWAQVGGFGLPGQARFDVGPLAPGQSYSFHELDKHLASTRMEYRVIVDFYNNVPESDESNNTTRARLGGL